MTDIKPNMDCENCWLIVNEFDGDYACDECVADDEQYQATPVFQLTLAEIISRRKPKKKGNA
jgi:hypothetical protein